jgi:hypothetical protein
MTNDQAQMLAAVRNIQVAIMSILLETAES